MVLLSKMEAIDKYGTEAQKGHYEKYGKFKDRKYENRFIKTLEQHFESVEIVKDTKPYMYRLEGIREQPVERQDGRKDNGKILEYRFELNSLVLDYMTRECTDEYFTYNSLSQWLKKVGIVDKELHYIPYNRDMQQYHLEHMQKQQIEYTNPVVVKNFTKIVMERFKANIASIFKKLSKLGLIEYKKESVGCQLDDEHRPLTKEEYSEIKKLYRELRSNYGFTKADLYNEDINMDVERFNVEFHQELKLQFGLKYTYLSHSVKWLHNRTVTRGIDI